jgi:hypothetical protein
MIQMEFSYKISASIKPTQVTRGSKFYIEVKISDPSEEVKKVFFEVLGYGIKMRIVQESGRYATAYDVPSVAPKGEYTIRFYAVNNNGDKGPDTLLKINVI